MNHINVRIVQNHITYFIGAAVVVDLYEFIPFPHTYIFTSLRFSRFIQQHIQNAYAICRRILTNNFENHALGLSQINFYIFNSKNTRKSCI